MNELKTLIREITWLQFSSHGWGCGYVIIPENHHLHGKHYSEIDVDVHGDLTFSDLITDELIERWPELSPSDKGKWIVGFDTAHAGDNIVKWPKELVQAETDCLLEQLKRYM